MSKDANSDSQLDSTVLQDQLGNCDEIIEDIRNRHATDAEGSSDATVMNANEIYQKMRSISVEGFSNRYQVPALCAALKDFLVVIGKNRGYENLMKYTTNFGTTDAVTPDIGVYWLKLYGGVVLNTQPDITFERSISHLKKHRNEGVVHADEVKDARRGPDPKFVNAVVPLWFALEDILDLWRRVLNMDPEKRKEREHVLKGEISPDGGLVTYRYGFVNKTNHEEESGQKVGFITDYQNGEDGKGSRFTIDDVDFFPKKGDIVRFRAEQQGNHSALTVIDTVTLVE